MKKLLFTLTLALVANALAAQTKTLYYPNGNKASEGVLLNADATILSNTFESLPKQEQADKMKNCPKDGKWTNWYANGQISSEEYYNNGTFAGVWKGYFENGNPSFVVDFTNLKSTNWFLNGKVESEGKILSDMRQDGNWVIYYENGSKNAEGNYANGTKDGTWTWWDTTGKKTNEQSYKNGAVASTKNF